MKARWLADPSFPVPMWATQILFLHRLQNDSETRFPASRKRLWSCRQASGPWPLTRTFLRHNTIVEFRGDTHMQTLIRLAFSAGLALSLSLTTEADAQQTVQALAQKASEEWLALVDAGRYGESWDAASEGFKAAVNREKWLMQLNGTRPALGRVISRKLAKSDYMRNPPEVPAGEYVATPGFRPGKMTSTVFGIFTGA